MRWTGIWDELENLTELRKRAPKDSDYVTERQVALFLSEEFAQERFHGVGSKRARNILQNLGLTRYEIPLDSRITKWLNTNAGPPYQVSGAGLSTPEYYHFSINVVQKYFLPQVPPCLFDAAVFSSYDTN